MITDEEIEKLRKAAHEAPLNIVNTDHKGRKSLGSHNTAWSSASRAYFDALDQRDRERGIQKKTVELATDVITNVGEPQSQVSFNEWFLKLVPERQAILKEDKWMLADNAFRAGQDNNNALVVLEKLIEVADAMGSASNNGMADDVIAEAREVVRQARERKD